MDIQGLVNHGSPSDKQFGSLSPRENSGSDSARSQYPVNSASTQYLPLPFPHRDRDEMYHSHYPLHIAERTTSPPIERALDIGSSANIVVTPVKRRLEEWKEGNEKKIPKRRRAHQACEACRAKKSKCDNERPRCGSCIQHDIECIYKGAPFVPSLDAGSLILLEKLNKLEATIVQQGIALGKIQEATTSLDPGFLSGNKIHSPFHPTQTIISTEPFQIPKGRWASLDYFVSLPFVEKLLPEGRKYENMFIDNIEIQKDHKPLNLDKEHVQKLVQHYLTEIDPLHPIMEVAMIERLQKELEEDGLSWNGETAIIMHILSIGALHAGLDSMGYNYAAKRRMGFAVEEINVMAIQAHYLQGLYFHLLCQPVRAARSFHHASVNAYFYFNNLRGDKKYSDLDIRLFWECMKMEKRYSVDILLPDPGLSSLDLVTELMPRNDTEPAKRHSSSFCLFLSRLGLECMALYYDSQFPNLQETVHLEALEKHLEEWHSALISPANKITPDHAKMELENCYETVNFLLYRPFLQYVLTQLTTSEATDLNTIPSNITTRAKKAINLAVSRVSSVRTLPLIDWFALKQVLLGSLLVLSASKVMNNSVISEKEVEDTLNNATEILAKAAKTSESAKRALQLILEIRVGMN